MTERQTVILTGFIGLVAASLVGIGEFLLHFDPQARYGQGFDFFKGLDTSQVTTGHFIGVLGAPLYLIGVWHIYLMLRPANEFWAKVAFFVMAYGFIVGAVWIGSRATASMIVNGEAEATMAASLALYDLRYENLLTVIRLAGLALSVIFVWLTLTGRSHYPRWMAVLNPILLIIVSFLIFMVAPDIGKYLMPIALNVAFFILFAVSTAIAIRSYKGTPQ